MTILLNCQCSFLFFPCNKKIAFRKRFLRTQKVPRNYPLPLLKTILLILMITYDFTKTKNSVKPY
ncbi:MAG: hypothetical protein COZ92_01980 [Candidatus Nealsonbacteria bacterium CG_4_8_14_3_um_filter_40_11]|uniref:Uncharacterized protein n=1 Tax=Candidatus Nealsonbacteria bacterium CG_4_8_14_3_um_filter_40_11 TaxID=1974690 RepID=A0A2M7IJU8_9BACT|nr:MAG: hypothetical protein COZ92_01980 [Candidatus Nealsonbacteria bacterium CG_4_8_14_3_um_filter_40_11]